MKTQAPTISIAELDQLLGPDAPPSVPWLRAAMARADVAGLHDHVICEIASERDERGPAASAAGLISALRARHAGDRVTLAMLAALEVQHLPDLLDLARGR